MYPTPAPANRASAGVFVQFAWSKPNSQYIPDNHQKQRAMCREIPLLCSASPAATTGRVSPAGAE